MNNIIDSCDHLSSQEKEEVKKIYLLVRKIEKVCQEQGDFNIILNALDLLKEYYMKQCEVFCGMRDEKKTPTP